MASTGRRPQSARLQSRINPITGEDMSLALTSRVEVGPRRMVTNTTELQMDHGFTPRQVTDTRPSGVPRLNLSQVVGRDDNVRDYTIAMDSPLVAAAMGYGLNVMSTQSNRIQAPQPGPQPVISSNKVCAAGTSSSQMAATVQKPKQPTAWDHPPVPEDMRLPSQRHLDQYQQLKQEAVESYRRKAAKVTEADVNRQIEQLRLNIPSGDDDDPPLEKVTARSEEDPRDQIQSGWTQMPYSKEATRKLVDKETMEEEKRKSKMLETVLVDQLCRPVISDPSQYSSTVASRATSYRPGMKRGSVRTLHDTKVRTDGSSTENLLSRRVRFEARLLTTVGRDALRELTGFFFAADNTLTVYEYRQFGKTSKAMPFIKRGSYRRLRYVNEHSPMCYCLADIMQGTDLYFETANQPVPDSIKTKPIMTLRISDVDDDAKKSILLYGVSTDGSGNDGQTAIWRQMQLPDSPDELRRKTLMHEIHEIVRLQICKKGIWTYTGIGRLLRKGDLNGDGIINKFELEKALIDFRITIPQDKFDDLWDLLDPEGTCFLEYTEFMRAFLGDMSEYRKLYVLKAFVKMDANKHGAVTFGDVRKFYNVHKHPKVRSGECTEDEIVKMFLDSFDVTVVKGELTFREFEEYYEGLSIGVESDEDFCNILRNAWNV